MNEVDSRSHDDKRVGRQTSQEYNTFVSLRHSIIWTSTFPHGSAGKESTCKVGDLGSIPGLGRSFLGRKGYPLHFRSVSKHLIFMIWCFFQKHVSKAKSIMAKNYRKQTNKQTKTNLDKLDMQLSQNSIRDFSSLAKCESSRSSLIFPELRDTRNAFC